MTRMDVSRRRETSQAQSRGRQGADNRRLTANATADEVAQYLAAGMRAVVEKPVRPSDCSGPRRRPGRADTAGPSGRLSDAHHRVGC